MLKIKRRSQKYLSSSSSSSDSSDSSEERLAMSKVSTGRRLSRSERSMSPKRGKKNPSLVKRDAQLFEKALRSRDHNEQYQLLKSLKKSELLCKIPIRSGFVSYLLTKEEAKDILFPQLSNYAKILDSDKYNKLAKFYAFLLHFENIGDGIVLIKNEKDLLRDIIDYGFVKENHFQDSLESLPKTTYKEIFKLCHYNFDEGGRRRFYIDLLGDNIEGSKIERDLLRDILEERKRKGLKIADFLKRSKYLTLSDAQFLVRERTVIPKLNMDNETANFLINNGKEELVPDIILRNIRFS